MRITSFFLPFAAAVVMAASCTNDFDQFKFDDEGGGGSGAGTTSTTSIGGGPTSTTTTSVTPGDCMSPLDCPGQDTDCRKRACSGGLCGFSDELAGTPCNDFGGKVCNGFGNCVACLGNIDCVDGGICLGGSCLPPDCNDGLLNLDETDVDCGGSTCPPCLDGSMCMVATDCESGVCTGNICVPCTTGADCAPLGPSFWCDAGTCSTQLLNGDPCTLDAECQSGFCPPDDGVCCDSACGSLCESCLIAKTGVADGSCAPVIAGTDPDGECTPSAATCTADTCSGIAGQCAPAAAGLTCRAAQGICDLPESCDGVSTGCPSDLKQPSTAVCRLAIDICDATETCDGVNDQCPPDLVQPPSFTCRPVMGPCDVAETCDGSGVTCPNDAFIASGGASIGNSCTPYLCDGTQASCPTTCTSASDCVAPADCVGMSCQ